MSASAPGRNLDGRCSRARQHRAGIESGRAWAGAPARGSIAAAVAAVSIAAGGVAYLAGATRVADAVWAVAIAALLLVLLPMSRGSSHTGGSASTPSRWSPWPAPSRSASTSPGR